MMASVIRVEYGYGDEIYGSLADAEEAAEAKAMLLRGNVDWACDVSLVSPGKTAGAWNVLGDVTTLRRSELTPDDDRLFAVCSRASGETVTGVTALELRDIYDLAFAELVDVWGVDTIYQTELTHEPVPRRGNSVPQFPQGYEFPVVTELPVTTTFSPY
mgnify:CR=1 FL=1|jgi:hypothetical protein|tara:strand:- start:128 stop:604 length:477 start_codon:yes stop_codon:yes gene_type:complete